MFIQQGDPGYEALKRSFAIEGFPAKLHHTDGYVYYQFRQGNGQLTFTRADSNSPTPEEGASFGKAMPSIPTLEDMVAEVQAQNIAIEEEDVVYDSIEEVPLEDILEEVEEEEAPPAPVKRTRRKKSE